MGPQRDVGVYEDATVADGGNPAARLIAPMRTEVVGIQRWYPVKDHQRTLVFDRYSVNRLDVIHDDTSSMETVRTFRSPDRNRMSMTSLCQQKPWTCASSA